MKRITLTLLVLLVSVSLFASYSTFDLGVSANYSSVLEQPCISIGGIYRNYAQADSVKFGFTGRADVGIGLGKASEYWPLSTAVFLGAGLSFDVGRQSAIYFGIGPAATFELKAGKKGESSGLTNLGIGLGADAAFGYYFDTNRTVGVVAGAFGYGTLYNFGTKKNSFQFIGGGYVGMSFGFGEAIVDVFF